MTEFTKIFGHYTVADLVMFLTAMGFLIVLAKKLFELIAKGIRTIDEVNEKLNRFDDLNNKFSSNQEGTLALLRFRIRRICERKIAQGYTTIAGLDELKMMFDAYVKMGGNGTTKKLYEEVLELPIKQEVK